MDSKITVQAWPESMAALPMDRHNIHQCLVHGLFKETISFQKRDREFLTYLPQGLTASRPVLIAVCPSKEDIVTYLQTSGLIDLANLEQLYLCALIPETDWSCDKEADYMNAVWKCVLRRKYYVAVQENIYALGIGDGAMVAQLAAIREPENWSGVASIGEINSQMISAAQKPQETKTPMPVWMLCSQIGPGEQALLDYWMEQNDSDERYLSGDGADRIYVPHIKNIKVSVDEEKIAQVRVTESVPDKKSLPASVHRIWAFLQTARRHRGSLQKHLRYYMDWRTYGAQPQELDHDGFTRRWLEYIPQSVKGSGASVPLVVVCHGRAQSPEIIFDLTAMARVAEARGFIAVFPQAGVYQQSRDGVKNVPFWMGSYDGKSFDDVGFIKKMIDDICVRLPVDTNRIYCCGFSSGGMMSAVLSEEMSGTFAAISCWSGLLDPDSERPYKGNPQPPVPLQVLMGSQDVFFADRTGCDCYGMDAALSAYFHQRVRDCGLEEVPCKYKYTCGNISWSIHHDPQGVPMMQVGLIRGMPHAVCPFEGWLVYDGFFSKFSRDYEKNLYYMGKKVENLCSGQVSL